MTDISSIFKNKKFMTFDCYGTLMDWESGIVKTMKTLLKKKGIEKTSEEILTIYSDLESEAERGEFVNYKTILRNVTKDLFSNFKIELDKNEIDVLIYAFREFEPFSDTVSALKLLGSKYKLGIISNVDLDIFNYTLKKLDVNIPFIIATDSVGFYKPSHEVFKYALKLINAQPEEMVHVAQSLYHDIKPVKELGITSILVNRSNARDGFGAVPKMDLNLDVKPDLVIEDLKTLTSLI